MVQIFTQYPVERISPINFVTASQQTVHIFLPERNGGVEIALKSQAKVNIGVVQEGGFKRQSCDFGNFRDKLAD